MHFSLDEHEIFMEELLINFLTWKKIQQFAKLYWNMQEFQREMKQLEKARRHVLNFRKRRNKSLLTLAKVLTSWTFVELMVIWKVSLAI